MSLYPVYIVKNDEGTYEKGFTRGNTNEKALTETSFKVFTDSKNLYVNVKAEDLMPGQEISILFDPKRNGRKPHNMIMLSFTPSKETICRKFLFKYETVPLPPSFSMKEKRAGKFTKFEISIPLSFINPYKREAIGFNVFRKHKDNIDKWSGLPSDNFTDGQGAGDLLFANDRDFDSLKELKDKYSMEKNKIFTRWEKREIPAELYSYMSKKKKGFSVRIKKEDVSTILYNSENTIWGKTIREKILEVADYWACKDDSYLFDLVPSENPRALSVGQYFGDPLEGGKRTAFQVCLEKPYMYYSTKTGQWWYEGKKIINPGTGEEVIFTDDGSGFISPEGFPNPGVRYMFKASYRLFLISMLMAHPYCDVLEDKNVLAETTGSKYSGAISNLAFAYILTGEKVYARKALILIGRIAELLPYMNGNYGDGTYSDTVHIAEPSTTESQWFTNFFEACDLLYDIIDELNDEIADFFKERPDPENKIRTEAFDIKEAIHGMIPYLIYSCELEKTRASDWSMRYIHLELILAAFMESGKLMQETLFDSEYSFVKKIRNCYFNDGRYAYDSIGYVERICTQAMFLPNDNYKFKDDEYFTQEIDMFEDSRFGLKQAIMLYFRLRSGPLSAMFGDTATDNFYPFDEERSSGLIPYQPAMDILYHRMPSSRKTIGRILSFYPKDYLDNMRARSVSSTHLNQTMLLLACAQANGFEEYLDNGPYYSPFLLQDSQISILRSGPDPFRTKHVMLYGQPTAGHVHGDKLGLWIGAYGHNLLSGAGLYPFTWISPKFKAWEVHSAACTVVLIDGKDQEHSWSKLNIHYEGVSFQLSAMENDIAYPGSKLERMCCLITTDDKINSYVLDINYVSVGNTFDYNTAGLDLTTGDIEFDLPSSSYKKEAKGTLAGEDVPMYSTAGQGWLKVKENIRPGGPFSFTYKYKGAALKVHSPFKEDNREVFVSVGERGGDEMGKSRMIPFVTIRDHSLDRENHRTVFANILEPYEEKPFIQKTLSINCKNAQGMEIFLDDGSRDVVIYSGLSGAEIIFNDSCGINYSTDAVMLLIRFKNDNPVFIEALGASFIKFDNFIYDGLCPALDGIVDSLDIDTGIIRIKPVNTPAENIAEQLDLKVAIISSPDYPKPSSYYVYDPMYEDGIFEFKSDMSLIRGDINWPDPQKKLGMGKRDIKNHMGNEVLVDIKPGDKCMIYNSFRKEL